MKAFIILSMFFVWQGYASPVMPPSPLWEPPKKPSHPKKPSRPSADPWVAPKDYKKKYRVTVTVNGQTMKCYPYNPRPPMSPYYPPPPIPLPNITTEEKELDSKGQR